MLFKMEETMVLVVGAGPAGLAMSACLNILSVPNIVLEREDCHSSLWKKKSYDRLKLHLAKEFCHLPHMPFPSDAPTYIPKSAFISYLDNYVSLFDISPRFFRSVDSASYDAEAGKWRVHVENKASGALEKYLSKFLVVATGENGEGVTPDIPGLPSYPGEVIHSSSYENGEKFCKKRVLVVGCGNSGMEIAFDLSNYGARPSLVSRSPIHVLPKEIVHMGMSMLQFLPCTLVDFLAVQLSGLKYGNFADYGLQRPQKGPFYLKATTGRSPTIDVGTMDKIKTGEIQVLPAIVSVQGNKILFENGETAEFDSIILATGYKSTVRYWLKDGYDLFNENGMPKQQFPNHWKGENGLYCVGFAQKGLAGISSDAQLVAKDISSALGLK